MVVCLKLDFRGISGVRIIIFIYLQGRYVKKDSLYFETFDEVVGAHLSACSQCSSETSREKTARRDLFLYTGEG
jgi:hypothetical protein